MLFRTLEKWYDLFSYGDGRATEERIQREKECQQWQERRRARKQKEDARHEYKINRLRREDIERIELPVRSFYETEDGYRAAKLVEKQRHEEGRSKRYRRNLSEAHEQMEDAEQEGWQDTLRTAFEGFDAENKQRRIERLREELDLLLGAKEDSSETGKDEPDWEEINSKPARGWAISGNGEKYRQMVELRAPVLPKEEVTPEVEAVPGVDWKSVNEQARLVTNGKQALQLAEEVDQSEVSDFWLQLAKEYELDEEEIDEGENGNGRKR